MDKEHEEEASMSALEISEVYMKLAERTKDKRWKRHLLELASIFAEEWFGKKGGK